MIESPGGQPTAAAQSVERQVPGWVILPVSSVPARWRNRAQHVALIPLLAAEAEDVLAATPAVPLLDEHDEALAQALVAGASLRQMAHATGLSQRGVGHRVARLRERFGVDTRAELIAELARHGFTTAGSGNDAPRESARAAQKSPIDRQTDTTRAR